MKKEQVIKNLLLFKLIGLVEDNNPTDLRDHESIEKHIDNLVTLYKKGKLTKDEVKSKFYSDRYKKFFLKKIYEVPDKVIIDDLTQVPRVDNSDKEKYLVRKKDVEINGEKDNLTGFLGKFNAFKIDYYVLKLGFNNYAEAKQVDFDITKENNLKQTPIVEQVLNAIKESHQSIFNEIQKIQESISKLSSNNKPTSDVIKKVNSLSKRIILLKEESNDNFKALERNQNNSSNKLINNQSQIHSLLENITKDVNKLDEIKDKIDETKDEIILNQKNSTKQLKKHSWVIGVLIITLALILIVLNHTNETIKKETSIKSNFVFSDKNKAISQKQLSIPYDTIYTYWNDLAKVYKDSTYGFINTKGNLLFTFDCDYVTNFENGFAIIKRNNKYSYINKKGELLDDFKYQKANMFHDGLALVKDNNGFKFIDKQGRDSLILNSKYKFVADFSDGLAVIKKEDRFGTIDKKGNEIVIFSESQFDTIYSFHNDIAKIKKGDKYGLINIKEEIILPQIYSNMYRNQFGLYLFGVTWNRKGYSVANKDGKIISNRFTDYVSMVFPFEDVVKIEDKKTKKIKILDENGKVLISPILYRLSKFYKGVALAQLEEKGDYYFIDKIGNTLLTIKYSAYEDINDHYQDLIYVYKNKKYGFINNKGEQIIPLIYDEIDYVSFSNSDFSPVKTDNKWGIINKKGDLIAPFKYDYLSYYSNNLFGAKLGDKEFIVNEKGIIIANNKYY